MKYSIANFILVLLASKSFGAIIPNDKPPSDFYIPEENGKQFSVSNKFSGQGRPDLVDEFPFNPYYPHHFPLPPFLLQTSPPRPQIVPHQSIPFPLNVEFLPSSPLTNPIELNPHYGLNQNKNPSLTSNEHIFSFNTKQPETSTIYSGSYENLKSQTGSTNLVSNQGNPMLYGEPNSNFPFLKYDDAANNPFLNIYNPILSKKHNLYIKSNLQSQQPFSNPTSHFYGNNQNLQPANVFTTPYFEPYIPKALNSGPGLNQESDSYFSSQYSSKPFSQFHSGNLNNLPGFIYNSNSKQIPYYTNFSPLSSNERPTSSNWFGDDYQNPSYHAHFDHKKHNLYHHLPTPVNPFLQFYGGHETPHSILGPIGPLNPYFKPLDHSLGSKPELNIIHEKPHHHNTLFEFPTSPYSHHYQHYFPSPNHQWFSTPTAFPQHAPHHQFSPISSFLQRPKHKFPLAPIGSDSKPSFPTLEELDESTSYECDSDAGCLTAEPLLDENA